MANRDHQGLTINQFNGLWSRGGQSIGGVSYPNYDTVPIDHFSDGLNFECLEGGVKTRAGFDNLITFSSIKRMYTYEFYGQSSRILFLDDNGSIWDSTNLSVPILTIAGMTDFAFANINGFAFISPHNGDVGLAGESLYIYLGSGTARKAGGSAPSGSSFIAANSATSGNIEIGFHIFAVAYETNTGFITAPGPLIFATITATGGLSIDLSGIPVGDSSIAARRILATKVITDYNGNQEGYEFFFIPNGRIANNIATTLTVSFFDADLFTSADYLFDLFANIPAGNHITTYGDRLCIGGENANPSVIRISANGQPEAINQVNGLIIVDQSNSSSAVTNAQQFRDLLYISKKTRWYSVNDDGGDPSTWKPIPLDEGLGADVHSIATVLDTGGINYDKIFVANPTGFYIFKGYFVQQELSWKIKDIWNRINAVYFHTVQIALDPNTERVYIAVPLDNATSPSHILVMDYEKLFDETLAFQQVRWYKWTIANASPTSVAILFNNLTQIPELIVGSSSGNIYNQNPSSLNDDSTMIPTPFIQTALMPAGAADGDGSVLHFGGIRLRVFGTGILHSTLYSYDSVTNEILADYTMSTVPGIEKFFLSFFVGEKVMLKLSLTSVNYWFKIQKIRFFVNELWEEHPG